MDNRGNNTANRELARAAVLSVIDSDARLVTLTGPAGVGKTWLALDAGLAVSSRPEWRVHFLSLERISSEARLVSKLCVALGLREGAAGGLPDRLAAAIARSDTLLICDGLDGFGAFSPLLGELLTRDHRLRVLATRRQAFATANEFAIPVAALATEPERELGMDSPGGSESARFFVACAAGVNPQLILTTSNVGSVVELGKLLEGSPRAIELVAKQRHDLQLGALLRSVEAIAKDEGDASDTAIAWSLHQLPEELRKALHILAVMEGGFDLRGANQLISGAAEESNINQQELDQLLTAGFVIPVDSTGRSARYDMQEFTRQFLLRRLRRTGQLSRLQLTYARQLLEQAESLRPVLESPENHEALAWFDLEHDNLRAALGIVVGAQRDYLARRLTCRMWRFWMSRGLLADGRFWLDTALALFDPEHPDELETELQFAAASIALAEGDAAAARRHVTLGLGAAKDARDEYWRALLLSMSGQAAAKEGDFAHALSLFQLVLKVIEPLANDKSGAASARDATLLAASAASFAVGDAQQAEQYVLRAQELAVASKNRQAKGQAGLLIAGFAAARGDRKAALAGYREAIPLLFECGDDAAVSEGFAALSAMAMALGLADRSAELLGSAEQLGITGGLPTFQSSIIDRVAIRQALVATIGESMLGVRLTNALELRREQYMLLLDQSIDDMERALEPQPADFRKSAKAIISRREIEVLKLVAEGRSDQQIADELFIARRTVNDHVGKILMKLDVHNRTGAVARGRELGLI